MIEKYIKIFMERVYKFLDGLIAFLFILNYNNSPQMKCYEDSQYYQYAHSLSQNRPVEFEDLEYTRLILTKRNIAKGTATVRLNFCMDESIDLEIEGLFSNNPVIKLAWGELERTKETLWQKNK